nr:chromosome partitioning protein ParA [Nostocaceae cyanobacterium]
GKTNINNLLINSSSQGQLKKLPIYHEFTDSFWAEELYIEGFFPLELINLYLSDKKDKVFSHVQADSSGNVRLSVASLYDLLSPNSNWYALDYQRLGEELQLLIKMEIAPLEISWTWNNQTISLSGLSSEEIYSLSCWNLLIPEKSPLEIKIPLISPDEDNVTIRLELLPGIYHVQLFAKQKLLHNLGWWCNSNQTDLPDEALENEALENYCYTILGNESIPDFLNAAQNFDYEYQLLETAIHSLCSLSYHFPKWLDKNSLSNKLEALINTLKIQLTNPNLPPVKPIVEPISTKNIAATKKSWLLIKLTIPKKRDYIHKIIKIKVVEYKLQDEILSIQLPTQWIYKDSILLQCNNIEIVNSYIQTLDYVQTIQPLLSQDAQKIS